VVIGRVAGLRDEVGGDFGKRLAGKSLDPAIQVLLECVYAGRFQIAQGCAPIASHDLGKGRARCVLIREVTRLTNGTLDGAGPGRCLLFIGEGFALGFVALYSYLRTVRNLYTQERVLYVEWRQSNGGAGQHNTSRNVR